LKKAREPLRHSAFTSFGVASRVGIGMDTGRQVGSLVGSAVGVIAGARPTSDSRESDPQPTSSMQANRGHRQSNVSFHRTLTVIGT
jgi:hypothetical protein